MSNTKTVETGKFLVCGLGALNQYCTVILKEFGTSVDLEPVTNWKIPNVPALMTSCSAGIVVSQ